MPLRVKLATDRPKPKLAKPLPVIVKLVVGEPIDSIGSDGADNARTDVYR